MIFDSINPLTVSKITWKAGHREGMHPYHRKLLKRKNPIRAWFGVYEPAEHWTDF